MTRAIYRAALTRLQTDILILSRDLSKMVDELVVGVLNNSAKIRCFSIGRTCWYVKRDDAGCRM